MKISAIILCALVSAAFGQDSSGSGGGEPLSLNITLTTKLNETFTTYSDNKEITGYVTTALGKLNKEFEKVKCQIDSVTEGSIVVVFTVTISGDTTQLQVSDKEDIVNAIDTNNTIAGYLQETGILDLNECVDTSFSNCPDFRKCVNNFGGFTCECTADKFDVNGNGSECVEPIAVTCLSDGIEVKVMGGYMNARNIQAEDLRLFNETCSGQNNVNNDAVITINGLSSCGTTKTATATTITYHNTVSNAPKSTDIIITGATLTAPFTCSYPVGVTASLDPFQGSIGSISTDNKTANGTFEVTMALYTDVTFAVPETKTSFETTEKLYIQAKVKSQDDDLNVNFRKCWATPSNDSSDSVNYNLIDNYCADTEGVDGSIEVLQTADRPAARFAVQVFKFVGDNDQVYIHCEIEICNGVCINTCLSSRKRRNVRSVITHSLNRQKRQTLDNDVLEEVDTVGPIYRVVVETEGLDPIIIVLISILIFILLCLIIVLLIVAIRRRRNRKDQQSSVAFGDEKYGNVNTAYQ